jgi:site-specific DNA recombinase
MKAFLIARVSTLDQSDALPGQIYRLNDYATSKGYDSELFQIKESAYKGNRISFMSIIDKIRKHPEICVVVFDKIDRYTRNSNSEEVSLLNSLCRAGLIEMHFPSDHLFINKESSAQEHFMLNMGVSSAQYYSDSISDNVKRRNQQKYRDGEWCHKAPFGYKNIELQDAQSISSPTRMPTLFVISLRGMVRAHTRCNKFARKYTRCTASVSRLVKSTRFSSEPFITE